MSYQRISLDLDTVAPDALWSEAPLEAWNEAEFVHGARGLTERQIQFSQIHDAGFSIDIRVLQHVRVSGTDYWVWAGTAGIYAWDGSTRHDISPASGWPSSGGPEVIFTACEAGGLVYFNRTDADPVYWNGDTATACTTLTDWPPGGRCIALRAHRGFLFAVGMISENPQRVRWSGAAAPGSIPSTWTPGASNLAGFVDLMPSSTDCLDAAEAGQDLMIFKGDAVWLASFVGGPDVFAFRQVSAEHGIAGTHALCVGPSNEVLFLGSDADAYLTDGVRFQSLLQGRMADAVADALERAPENGLFGGATLMRLKLGTLWYPGYGTGITALDQLPTNGLVYDFESGSLGRWGVLATCFAEGRSPQPTMPGDWDSDADSWESDPRGWDSVPRSQGLDDVVAGHGGAIYEAGAKAGIALSDPARALKAGLALGAPDRRKLVSRLWPRVQGENGTVLRFRVGTQDDADGPITFGDWIEWSAQAGGPVDVFASGRFFAIEVDETQVFSLIRPAWKLAGFDVEYRILGDF